MVKHFTEADWNNKITISDETMLGIVVDNTIVFPEDTIVQVYERLSENEYNLIMFGGPDFRVTIINNEIIVTNNKAFNGKIVIK